MRAHHRQAPGPSAAARPRTSRPARMRRPRDRAVSGSPARRIRSPRIPTDRIRAETPATPTQPSGGAADIALAVNVADDAKARSGSGSRRARRAPSGSAGVEGRDVQLEGRKRHARPQSRDAPSRPGQNLSEAVLEIVEFDLDGRPGVHSLQHRGSFPSTPIERRSLCGAPRASSRNRPARPSNQSTPATPRANQLFQKTLFLIIPDRRRDAAAPGWPFARVFKRNLLGGDVRGWQAPADCRRSVSSSDRRDRRIPSNW